MLDYQGNRDDATEQVAAQIEDGAVAAHVSRYACGTGANMWLAAVWSERDDALRARSVAELGEPRPSGYMSEECGWAL